MSATKSLIKEFTRPFRPSDVYRLEKWLERYNSDVWIGNIVIDEKSVLVLDMTTYYDDDYPGLPDRDIAYLNQWTAMRSGQCEICQAFPAKHYMHLVGDHVYAGVCDKCANQERDDELQDTGEDLPGDHEDS